MEYNADEAGTLTLADVGGMLPDCKETDYSSSAPPEGEGSDSDSASSVHGVDAEEIEVSSLHCASVHIPTLPEPAHTCTDPWRSSAADVPMPVVDAADIV
jgi:hypothetical protein